MKLKHCALVSCTATSKYLVYVVQVLKLGIVTLVKLETINVLQKKNY